MGKYMPLTQWLYKCSTDSVKLTFSELEDILGFTEQGNMKNIKLLCTSMKEAGAQNMPKNF